MIFTGRIGVFKEGIEEVGESELVQLKISYGKCQPTAAAETAFLNALNAAESEAEKGDAKNILQDEIGRCKSFTDKDTCRGQGCVWKG
jgi:hypothetical protein